MKTVSNQELTIRVSEHGAELSSIVANATGKEYLWQADPAFWKRHSPVLFPIVGSVWKAEYRNEGTMYPLSQHGFARDMDFTLIDEAENELRFALESTPDTLRAYPFPFLLEIGYRLEGNKVEVLWRVKNTGDKTMHFQIGAHPAFLYPNYEVDRTGSGVFRFRCEKRSRIPCAGGKRVRRGRGSSGTFGCGRLAAVEYPYVRYRYVYLGGQPD